jgi:hypothetical protein
VLRRPGDDPRSKVSAESRIDAHTLARLIALGRDPDIDNPFVVHRYEDLRYRDAINRLGWQHWETAIQDMLVDDLVALVKGLVIAERRFEWAGGSVSAVNWALRVLQRRDFSLSETVADWILRRSANPYAPYGSYNRGVVSRQQLDALDSMSPEERNKWLDDHWQRVRLAQASRNEGKRHRNYVALARHEEERAVIEACKAARRRKLLARHWASRPAGWDAPAAAKWKAIIERADSLAPARRVVVVAENDQIPIDYFPQNWADCSAETLGQLSADARQAILRRRAPVTTGRWRSLAARVAGLDRRC